MRLDGGHNPINFKSLTAGVNKLVLNFDINYTIFRSFHYVMLKEVGAVQTSNKYASYAFKKLTFIDTKGHAIQVLVGGKQLEKSAKMEVNEVIFVPLKICQVYHLHGLCVTPSTFAGRDFDVKAMTYIFHFSNVPRNEWDAVCDGGSAAAKAVSLLELKKNPPSQDQELSWFNHFANLFAEIRGIVSSTPFKDKFTITDGSEDDGGALLKMMVSVAGGAKRVLKFDTLEVVGSVDEANGAH